MGVRGFTTHLMSGSQPPVEPATVTLNPGDILLIDGSSWCFHLYQTFCELSVIDSTNVNRSYWGGAYPEFDELITKYITKMRSKCGLQICCYTDGDRNGTIEGSISADPAAPTPAGMPFKRVLDTMRFETWRRRQQGRTREWSVLEQWCRDGTSAADEAFLAHNGNRYNFPLPELTFVQFYATLARLGIQIFTCPDEADMTLAHACSTTHSSYIVTNDTDLLFYRGTKVLFCKDLDACILGPPAGSALVAKSWSSNELCVALLSSGADVNLSIDTDHERWADVALLMGNDFSAPIEMSELFDAVGYPKAHSSAAETLPPRPTTRKASAVLEWASALPNGWSMRQALVLHAAAHPAIPDSRTAFVREAIMFSTAVYLGQPFVPLQQTALDKHLAAMQAQVLAVGDDDKRRGDVLRLHLDMQLDLAKIPESVWAVFGATGSVGQAAGRACRMISPKIAKVEHVNALMRMLAALATPSSKAQAMQEARVTEKQDIVANCRHQPEWEDILVGVYFQRMVKRLQADAVVANVHKVVINPSELFEGRIFHFLVKRERAMIRAAAPKQQVANGGWIAPAVAGGAMTPTASPTATLAAPSTPRTPSTPTAALSTPTAPATPIGQFNVGTTQPSATKSKRKSKRERATARKKENKAHAIAIAVVAQGTAEVGQQISSSPASAQQQLQPQTPQLEREPAERATSTNNYYQYLPIDDHEQEIMKMIGDSQVSVVQGETGSGKSSRVPIMLLRESLRRDRDLPIARIIISQPRRIACKGLFNRLSQDPEYGHLMGMRIGHGERDGAYNLNSGTGPGDNSLRGMVCCVTPGYLTRLLANHPASLQNVTHIIIDEVHERSIDTDLLCYLARDLLLRQSNTRLVLMSATVNTSIYQRYFERDGNRMPEPAFVGVRKFPVAEFYADSDLSQFGAQGGACMKLATKLKFACASAKSSEGPDKNLAPIQHELIVELTKATGRPGSAVLVFVPGMGDIETLSDMFLEANAPEGLEFLVIGIHSQLPFESQMAAFEESEPNIIKVVIATNAAESSVTIPDADTVICMGTCKELVYNPATNRTVLGRRWISRSAAIQRAGRTGRVRPGRVIRLYTHTMFKSMDLNPRAEIHQQPLDAVILMMRAIWDDAPVKGVLSSLIEPPKIAYMDRAYEQLHEANLVTDPDDEIAKTTSLGQFVSGLGIDPYLGRLIGLGTIFGAARESLVLAAVLSMNRSPFLMTSKLFQEVGEMNAIKRNVVVAYWRWDQGVLLSEPLTVLRMFLAYEQILRTETSHKAAMFLKANSLSHGRMSQLTSAVKSLRTRVASMLTQIEQSDKSPTTRYARGRNQRDSAFEALLRFDINPDPTCPLDPDNVCILRWLLVWVGMDQMFKLHGAIKPPRFTTLPQLRSSPVVQGEGRGGGAGAGMSTPIKLKARGATATPSNVAIEDTAVSTPQSGETKQASNKSQQKKKNKKDKKNGVNGDTAMTPMRGLAMRVQVIDPAHTGKNVLTDADLDLLFSSQDTLSSLGSPSVPVATPRKPSQAQLKSAAKAKAAAAAAAAALAKGGCATTIAPFLFDPNEKLFELVSMPKTKLRASLAGVMNGANINNEPAVDTMCKDWFQNKDVEVAAFAFTMSVKDKNNSKKVSSTSHRKPSKAFREQFEGSSDSEDDFHDYTSDDDDSDYDYDDGGYEKALRSRETMEDAISEMLANVSMHDSWAEADDSGGIGAGFEMRRRLRVRLTAAWCDTNKDALSALCQSLNGSTMRVDSDTCDGKACVDVTAEYTKGKKTHIKNFLKSFNRSVFVTFSATDVDVLCTSVSLSKEDIQDSIGENVQVSKQTLESKVEILFPVITDRPYVPASHQTSPQLCDVASVLHPARLWVPPIGIQLLGMAAGWRQWGKKTQAKLSAELAKASMVKKSSNSNKSSNTPKPKTPKGQVPDDVLVVDLSIQEGKWFRSFPAEDRECATTKLSVQMNNQMSIARLLTFHPVNDESGMVDGAHLHMGMDNGVPPPDSNVSLHAVAGLMMDIEGGSSRADWVTILPPSGKFGNDWVLKALMCSDVLGELWCVNGAPHSIDEETEMLCRSVGERLRMMQTIGFDDNLRRDVLGAFSV